MLWEAVGVRVWRENGERVMAVCDTVFPLPTNSLTSTVSPISLITDLAVL